MNGAEYSLKVKAVADLNSFNQVSRNFQSMISNFKHQSETMIDGDAEKAEIEKIISELGKLENAYQRSFQKGIGSLDLKKFNQIIHDENDKVDMQSIAKGFQKMGSEGSRMMNAFSSSLMSTNVQAKKTKTIFDDMATTMMNTVKWGISSSALNTFTGAVSEAYSYVKNLDKSLNDIRIVSQKSAKEMEVFAKHANTAAQSLGSTTLDYSNAALIYYQQGLSEDAVKERTDITVKMANVLGTTAEEVSNYMTAVWNNFDDGSKSLEYYADVITKLGAATASSAEEISDGLEKFAAVAETVGLSYEYATAALATVTSETRQSADVVGTAFKTLFARIQDLELGDTLEDGVTLGKYSEALASVGINIKKSNGDLKDMDDILNEMGSTWGSLTKAQQVSLAQTVAGTRQYTQLIALMDNWDVFSVNLQTAYDAQGELTKEQAIYMESTEAHLNAAQAAWDEFKESILDSSVINFFADLSKMTGNIATLFSNSLGGGIPALIGGLSLASKTMSATFAEQAMKLKENRNLPKENERKTQEMESTKTWLSTLYGLSEEENNEILRQKEKMLEVSRFMDEEQEQELNMALAKEAELQNEISLWEEKLNKAEQYLSLMDKVQAMGNKAAEESDRPLEEFQNLKNDFSLNARKKGQLVPNVHENFEQSKLTAMEVSKSLSHWKENARGSREYISEQTSSFIGASKDTKPGIETRQHAGQNIKTEAQSLVNLWDKDENMKSYRSLFETVDKETTDAITERITALKKRLKTSLSDTKVYRGQVSDKSVDTVKKEVELIQKDIDKIITSTENRVAEVQGTLNTENASTKILSNEQELQKNTDIVNDKLEKFEGIATSEAWFKFAGSLGQIGTGVYAVGNAVMSLTDESLSPWEKFITLTSGSAIGLMSLVSGYKTLSEILPVVAVKIGAVKTAQDLENMSTLQGIGLTLKKAIALGVETVALKLKAVWQAIVNLLTGDFTALGVAAVAAVVALAGAMVYGLVKLEEYCSTEAKLNREVERTTEVAEKAREAYQKIQDTFNNYQSAQDKLKGLEEGTVEFYNALIEANERAMELIDTLDLIAGEDYAVDPNGLIQINEEALEDAMYDKQREVFRTQGVKANAKYNLASYERDQIVSEFRNAANDKSRFGVGMDYTTAENVLSKNLDEEEINGEYVSRANLSGMNDVATSLDQMNDKLGGVGTAIVSGLVGPINLIGGTVAHEMITQGFKDGVTDITEEVGQFRGEYNAKTAEMLALERQIADSYIRAYGDKKSLEIYNKANSKQKQLMQDYTTQKRQEQQVKNQQNTKNKGGWNSFWDTSDNGFWGSLGINLLGGVLNGITGGIHGGQQIYSQVTSISDMELKEQYAKNVLGYTQDDKGQWRDSSGKKVKEKEIRKISLDDATDAYNSGEYSVEGSTKEITKTLANSKDKSSKAGFDTDSQDYIAEALLAYKTGDTTFDWSALTDEEKKQAREQIAQDFKDNGSEFTSDDQRKTVLNMNNQKYDETKRKNSDSKRFEEALESEAEGLDTSTDALRLYALAQEKAAKSTKNLTAATAKNAAASYKFNKAYNEGRKAFTDNKEAWDTYVKAIKSGEEISYDVADAAGEIVKSLREMGINLSNEQLQDPEALKQIKTLFSGTEAEAKKAYEVLRDMSWLHDLVNNLGMAEDKAKSFIATLKSTDLNNPIDTTKLQESFGNTQKTLEEWKAWAEQYGINIEVKEPTTEITEAELTHPERVSKHVIAAHKDGEGNDIAEYSYTETEYVAPEKVYGVGDLKFTKVSNGGGNFKPASTGGGSKSKPKKEDKIDEKKDRYHDINIELKQIANELQKVQDEQDNLVGSDLIANLQRQYNLLNKEIDKTAEKIGIARDEQNELQGILAGNGIRFNADGTIANYAEAWDAELAHVNSIIDKYNSLSTADAQEKYQETLDKAKERWNKFKEDMSRYDTLVTEEIPELESNIRTALDKQIEIKLEAFEYEIQIRLDMSEAERDWNEFKKKVIDGIKDDDILGNAKSKLKDFSTYYNAQGTGEIDATTTHVNKILQQLYQMDADQAAGAYGETYSYTNAQGELVTIDYNNRKQALDDLKEYYTQLMDSMTNLQELSEEIHQSYLDMMDETQEKFNEQLDTYGKLSDMISHDMNLTSLIFGEDSYSLLADFYKKQKENSLEQLDFQRKQVDFWRAQMDAAEEGSEEWENAKEKWQDAIDSWKSGSEQAIQDTINEYTNAVGVIFEDLNNKVTGGVGLTYASKEWELINKEADRYLDSINAIYETQTLQNKYLDAIEKSANPAMQQKINNIMEDELALLREKDKLSEYDIERANLRYEIAMKQLALEESQQKKTQLRLRRDSQGNYRYQYTEDENEVSKIKQELSDLYNQLYNLDTGQYKSNLDELYAMWEEFNQEMWEASKINDPEEKARTELLIKEKYGNMINDIVADNEFIQKNLHESTISELFDLYGQNTANYEQMTADQQEILDWFLNSEMKGLNESAFNNLFGLYDDNVNAFKTMTDAEIKELTSSFVPQFNTTFQTMADVIKGEGGFVPTCKDAFDALNELGKTYLAELTKLYDEYIKKSEAVQNETQDLVKDNDELIKTYQDQLDQIQLVIDELEKLEKAYATAAESAKKAATEAKAYWTAAQNQNANVDSNIKDAAPKPTVTENTKETVKKEEQKQSLALNSYVKVKSGQTWYAASDGSGSSGTARSGTIVKINSGSKYPYNIDWLGWVKREAIEGYDTGGYTGEWSNSDGKLAMLHQKELVLNANDTKNILNAVEILRGITSNLGQALMNQMASISAAGATAMAGAVGSEGLEQNVHIDAQFPNVKDSREIETALNNLVNMASQHIQKN